MIKKLKKHTSFFNGLKVLSLVLVFAVALAGFMNLRKEAWAQSSGISKPNCDSCRQGKIYTPEELSNPKLHVYSSEAQCLSMCQIVVDAINECESKNGRCTTDSCDQATEEEAGKCGFEPVTASARCCVPKAGGSCGDDSDCPNNQVCDKEANAFVGTCVDDTGSCTDASDCLAGQDCVYRGDQTYKVCVYDPCRSDKDCNVAQFCDIQTGSFTGTCRTIGTCTNDSDCSAGYHCETSEDPSTGTGSFIGYCQPDGCSTDADCPAGYNCDKPAGSFTGTCAPDEDATRCSSDSQCSGDGFCLKASGEIYGECTPGCSNDSHCPASYNCVKSAGSIYGSCVEDTGDCENDGDCDANEYCHKGDNERFGICLADGECEYNSDCELGYICQKEAGQRYGICASAGTGGPEDGITIDSATFCGQSGKQSGELSTAPAIPCEGPYAYTCNDGNYNYCCFDEHGDGVFDLAAGDTCFRGDTDCVKCQGESISILCTGTYDIRRFTTNENVSCPYNGCASGSCASTVTGPMTLSFGSNECGQIDVNDACGVCKSDGCGEDTTTRVYPTPTPAPNSCAYTPCTGNNTCIGDLICVTSNIDGNNYCAIDDYATACRSSADSSKNNAFEYCCTPPTATPTATPEPNQCGWHTCTDDNDCQGSLICTSNGYCAIELYKDNCEAEATEDNAAGVCCEAPTATPTATPAPNQCGWAPCVEDNDCEGELICVESSRDGRKYCSMTEYEEACAESAEANDSGMCCAATPTPTLPPGVTPDPTAIPTPGEPTQAPSYTVVTTINCNDVCSSDGDCSNPSHICSNNRCRLNQNPSDEYCRLPSGGTTITMTEQEVRPAPQPTLPTEHLVAGPNWGAILKFGLGALALGALMILFL